MTPANMRKWQFVFLSNLAIPIYFMLQETTQRLVLGMGALFVLALLHVAAVRMRTGVAVVAALQVVIILALGFFYNPMYLYLAFIISYTISLLRLPVTIALTAMFAAGAAFLIAHSGQAGELQFWMNMLPPLFGGCISPYIIRASVRYQEMARRLQAATSQIERFAQDEERQRIARELHDTLGHTLSLIALKSEVVEKLSLAAPDKAASEARDIRETARAALKQMRELVTDMKLVRLADEWEHAGSLAAAADIRLVIRDRLSGAGDAASSNGVMTQLQESVLAMCVREALTNIVRHSRATDCFVELSADKEAIHCVVSDNGIGMGHGDEGADHGNGLFGMRQRLALLDGRLMIEDNEGKGTQLIMLIPLVKRKR